MTRTIANPIKNIKPEARNHPYCRISLRSIDFGGLVSLTQTMPTGPAGIEYAKVEAIEGRSPMMLNAIPKTSIMEKFLFNSCL